MWRTAPPQSSGLQHVNSPVSIQTVIPQAGDLPELRDPGSVGVGVPRLAQVARHSQAGGGKAGLGKKGRWVRMPMPRKGGVCLSRRASGPGRSVRGKWRGFTHVAGRGNLRNRSPAGQVGAKCGERKDGGRDASDDGEREFRTTLTFQLGVYVERVHRRRGAERGCRGPGLSWQAERERERDGWSKGRIGAGRSRLIEGLFEVICGSCWLADAKVHLLWATCLLMLFSDSIICDLFIKRLRILGH